MAGQGRVGCGVVNCWTVCQLSNSACWLGWAETGLGAEPGEGFFDALLQRNLGRTEDGVGFVHGGDVGAAGGRSAG